jgi:hypothetical protein
MFPELRKSRENQERMARTAQREHSRSQAELDELCESLEIKANRIKKMKFLAVVPPSLLDKDQRRFQFIDKNGQLDDPMELYRKVFILKTY